MKKRKLMLLTSMFVVIIFIVGFYNMISVKGTDKTEYVESKAILYKENVYDKKDNNLVIAYVNGEPVTNYDLEKEFFNDNQIENDYEGALKFVATKKAIMMEMKNNEYAMNEDEKNIIIQATKDSFYKNEEENRILANTLGLTVDECADFISTIKIEGIEFDRFVAAGINNMMSAQGYDLEINDSSEINFSEAYSMYMESVYSSAEIVYVNK